MNFADAPGDNVTEVVPGLEEAVGLEGLGPPCLDGSGRGRTKRCDSPRRRTWGRTADPKWELPATIRRWCGVPWSALPIYFDSL